jgi:hypothetical protein
MKYRLSENGFSPEQSVAHVLLEVMLAGTEVLRKPGARRVAVQESLAYARARKVSIGFLNSINTDE